MIVEKITSELKCGRSVIVNVIDKYSLEEIAKRLRKQGIELADDNPHIQFKLSYTLPYHEFNGIKELQLAFKEAKRFKKYYKGIVAIDLSEYVGNENDEYLEVFLMFLYDHRQCCKYIFYGHLSNELKATISKYLRCVLVESSANVQKRQYLKNLLGEKEYEYGVKFTTGAINFLSGLFAKNEHSFENLVEDLIETRCSKTSTISPTDITTYFADVNCIYKEIYDKEELSIEYEIRDNLAKIRIS